MDISFDTMVSDIMTILNENLISNLGLLGLDKNDAQVYLALLHIGPSRVWDIAKASGIKRPTCYVTLEKLAAAGAVKKSADKKHMTFSATAPKALWDLFETKRQNFKDSLNQLEALAYKDKDKPSVWLFEGIEGVKKALDLTLKLPKGEEILFYSKDELEEKFPDCFHEYLQSRVAKQIKMRGIFPDNAYLMGLLPPRDNLELRKSRFIPKNIFDPQIDVNIFADTIIKMVFTEKQPFAVVIENQALADDERQRFEFLWAVAEPPVEKSLDKS
jgi:sugar-specific transcriptional regulator TrmB